MSRHEPKVLVVMVAMGAVVIGCARPAPGTDPHAMSAAPDGFAVAIRTSDTSAAREVWRRAEALGPAGGPEGR